MMGNGASAVSAQRGPGFDSDHSVSSTRTVAGWAGAIGLLAGVVSFIGSWIPSVWNDEAATISGATRSWADLGDLLSHVDIVHGVYYSLMHVWFGVFGVSEFTLRLPSAVAVGVAAGGVVVLGARLSGLRVAILAGVIFAVLPRVTWMGTEGRSSGVVTAAAVWLTVMLLVALRRSGRVVWIFYGLAAAAAIGLWIYLALLVVAHGITVFWGSESRRRDLSAWAVSGLGGLLLASPVILLAKQQSGQVSWLQKPGLGVFKSVAIDQWFGTDGLRSLPLAVACWIAIGVALVRVLQKRESVGSGLSLAKIAFPWLILPSLGLIAYSMVLNPIYFPKYLAFSAPAVALLVGETVASISAVWLRRAALAGLVVLAIPSYLSERSLTAKDGSDWASVAAIVEQSKASGDAVVYGNLYNASGGPRSPSRVIDLSYPAAMSGLADVARGEFAGPSGKLWDASLPLSDVIDQFTDVDRVWVVADHAQQPADGSNPDVTALTEAGFNVVQVWPGSKTDLVLLSRPAAS